MIYRQLVIGFGFCPLYKTGLKNESGEDESEGTAQLYSLLRLERIECVCHEARL